MGRDDSGHQGQQGIWRDRDFTKLWAGQTVSTFGSHITETAIPLAALLLLAATPLQMGALVALEAAPVLLVGLLAGVWVDRLPRRPLLIAADLGRAALLLAIPAAYAMGRLSIGLLFAVVFMAGILTVLGEVAGQAYLPALLPAERLVEANGALGTGSSLAEIGGPSVAGALVQTIGAPFAILFDAASFVFSAVSLRLIVRPEQRATSSADPAATSEGKRTSGIRAEMAEGLRLVVRHPILRALAGSMGTFEFFGNFIGALYVLYLIRGLHLAPAAVGILVGMGGVSALAGSLLAERIVRRLGLGPTLIVSLASYGLLGAVIPLAGGPPLLVFALLGAAQLFGDAFIAVHLIAQVSLRQAAIPARLLGRANASMRVLERGVGPIGALLAGLLAQATAPRLALAIGVAGVVASSLWLVFSPVRGVKHAPPAPVADLVPAIEKA
ncbi:MAG TPA: MFS transporter [Ktedonobacterales bacterium]|nr:MFS transporter [Ktedonobacterales bacterium]